MKKNNIYDLVLTSVFAAVIVLMIAVPMFGLITIGVGISFTIIPTVLFIGVFLLPLRYSLVLGGIFGIGTLLRAIPYYTANTPSFDGAFVNPLVSVVPRLLTVIVAYLIILAFKKIQAKFKNQDVIIFSIIITISVFGFYYAAKAIALLSGWNASIVVFVALIMLIVFLSLYYGYINKRKDDIIIPSAILLSSLAHTVLVLGSLFAFMNGYMNEVLGSLGISDTLFSILYGTAATNGLIEALFAAVVGTPIIIALKNLKHKI